MDCFRLDGGALAPLGNEFGWVELAGAGVSASAGLEGEGGRPDGPSNIKRRRITSQGWVGAEEVGSWFGEDEFDELDPSSEEDELAPAPPPPSQSPNKRKVTNKASKPTAGPSAVVDRTRKGGRLGRLSAMLDQLPMEILAEILSHLPSASLLRLSRVAKLFRNLLHDRTASRAIWQAAFAREGLPKLEAGDLSEPAIASMIWDKECYKCGRKKVHHIHYRLRRRMCDPCLKELIRRPEDVARQGVQLHEATYLCTPHTTMPPWRGDYLRGQYYLEPELIKTSNHLNTLAFLDFTNPLPESFIPLNTDPPLVQPVDVPISTATAPAPAPTTLASLLAPAPAPAPATATATAPPATTPAPPPVPTFDPRTRVGQYVRDWVGDPANNVSGRMERAMRDAEALTAWQARLEDSRRAARSDHKSVRIQEIARHLREEGYEDVDITPTVGPFSKVLKEVEQPYPLTERVWRKIQGPVMREVERFRELRLNPPPPEVPLAPQELPPTIMVEPAVLQQFGVVGGRVMVQARATGAGASLLGGGAGGAGAYWAAGGGAQQQAGQSYGAQQAQRLAASGYVQQASAQARVQAHVGGTQLQASQAGYATAQQQRQQQQQRQPSRPPSQAGLYYQQLQQQQALLIARSQQLRQQQPQQQQPLLGQDLIRALLAQQGSLPTGQVRQAQAQAQAQPSQQYRQSQLAQAQRQRALHQPVATASHLSAHAVPAIRQSSAPPTRARPVDHLTLLNPLLAPQPAPRPSPSPLGTQSGPTLPPAPPLIPIPGCAPSPRPAFATSPGSGLRAPSLAVRSASQDQVPVAAVYGGTSGVASSAAAAYGQRYGVPGQAAGGSGGYDTFGRAVGRVGGVGMGQAHLLADWGQVRRPASAPPPTEGVLRGMGGY